MENPAYRWRKATDINREYALFELLRNEEVILNVGFSDSDQFEISFGNRRQIFEWEYLQKLIKEGRKLAEMDK